jgi:hypothetical protein
MRRIKFLLVCGWAICGAAFSAGTTAAAETPITRIWLTHRSADPTKIVVNWETGEPGDSSVTFAAGDGAPQTVRVDENVTLHHVEIPVADADVKVRYHVASGARRSAEASFKSYPGEEFRAAIVADWQGKPKFDAVTADDVHLLLTAGDNVPSLHGPCPVGVKDCTKPYSKLVDTYPELFRSTPWMPALGNHDREIRPRGPMPPPEPVYDVDATAYRAFFELPGDEWKWTFDVPTVGLRIVALDLNHIQDVGTTWQTCHPYARTSEQFAWYEKVMTGENPPFVVTLHNEKSGVIRAKEEGAWHALFRRGTIAVTGFGYFAERAVVDGFPYYNTALGAGAPYRDAKAEFFVVKPNYVLLRVRPGKMTVELKSLDGAVLDRQEYVGERR